MNQPSNTTVLPDAEPALTTVSSSCYQITGETDSGVSATIIVYVILILAVKVFDLYVDSRQYKCCQSTIVPDNFKAAFPGKGVAEVEQEFQKNQKYNCEMLKVTMAYKSPKALFWLVFFLVSGPQLIWTMNGLMLKDTNCAEWSYMTRETVFGILFCVEMHVVDSVWQCGCLFYRQFTVEEKFGFNTSTKCNFVLGQLQDFSFKLIRNLAYTLVATAVFYYAGKNLHEALYYILVAAITSFLVLFDSFGVMRLMDCGKKKNLQEVNPQLFEAVSAQATICGCNISKFHLDSSADTNHSNAYVDGVCCDKRCVISDSLVEDLPNQNHLLAVIRHEMGHSKMNHVCKNAALRCLFYTLIFVCIAAFILHCESQILAAFRVRSQSLYVAVFIVGNFAMSVLLYLFEIVENVVHRQQERDADIFSYQTTSADNATCINQALLQVFLKNKCDFVTDPWYSTIKNQHPTLLERIQNLEGKQLGDGRLSSRTACQYGELELKTGNDEEQI